MCQVCCPFLILLQSNQTFRSVLPSTVAILPWAFLLPRLRLLSLANRPAEDEQVPNFVLLGGFQLPISHLDKSRCLFFSIVVTIAKLISCLLALWRRAVCTCSHHCHICFGRQQAVEEQIAIFSINAIVAKLALVGNNLNRSSFHFGHHRKLSDMSSIDVVSADYW